MLITLQLMNFVNKLAKIQIFHGNINDANVRIYLNEKGNATLRLSNFSTHNEIYNPCN